MTCDSSKELKEERERNLTEIFSHHPDAAVREAAGMKFWEHLKVWDKAWERIKANEERRPRCPAEIEIAMMASPPFPIKVRVVALEKFFESVMDEPFRLRPVLSIPENLSENHLVRLVNDKSEEVRRAAIAGINRIEVSRIIRMFEEENKDKGWNRDDFRHLIPLFTEIARTKGLSIELREAVGLKVIEICGPPENQMRVSSDFALKLLSGFLATLANLFENKEVPEKVRESAFANFVETVEGMDSYQIANFVETVEGMPHGILGNWDFVLGMQFSKEAKEVIGLKLFESVSENRAELERSFEIELERRSRRLSLWSVSRKLAELERLCEKFPSEGESRKLFENEVKKLRELDKKIREQKAVQLANDLGLSGQNAKDTKELQERFKEFEIGLERVCEKLPSEGELRKLFENEVKKLREQKAVQLANGLSLSVQNAKDAKELQERFKDDAGAAARKKTSSPEPPGRKMRR